MSKLWEQIKSTCYDEESGLKKRIVLSIILIIVGLGIIVWFLLRLFVFERHWNVNHNVNLPDAGQIGDFIGGLSGTLFTLVGIILLFETLALQRTELSESRRVFVKQQFDNTFFELIRLYHSLIQEIDEVTEDGNKKKKNLFDYAVEEMQKNFVPQRTFAQNRNLAKHLYTDFYIKHLNVTSPYFKMIYRIYQHIDKSEISEKEKLDYAKIFRSQLADSELFLIRYNAMTENGSKSVQYLNKYNILKHLSNFQLLEFKDWWKKLDAKEKNGLGYLFLELKETLVHVLRSHELNLVERKFKSGRFTVKLTSIYKYQFEISFIKDLSKKSSKPAVTDGLEKFSSKEIEDLLQGISKELIVISNFNSYNNRKNLIFSGEITELDSLKTEVTVTVTNVDEDDLIIIER